MTINNTTSSTTVAGNGAQTQFTFSFIGVAAQYISVILTDSGGISTVLANGSGTTQYQLVLNPPVEGALWGVGGTVTYNPSGTPIPAGSTLTIERTLPLTQAVSLQNLTSLSTLGDGAETGLDTLEMQLQQVDASQGRAIVAPVVDPPTINLILPPAAQRANTGLAFDASGNVIAGTTPATGLISTAMQPVVDAASLALGRAALGLGNAAVENIGLGLQDNGAGDLQTYYNVIQDSINQTVTSAFHATQRLATGALNYQLPRANTLFNGFGFWVSALTGSITFLVNASDNFAGMSSGVSLVIPAGTQSFVSTNAASSGAWSATFNSLVGLDAPLNLQINATVAASALTVSLKDRNGNDPSTTSPVLLAFRNPTLTSGAPVIRALTSGLSIVVPNTALLGTTSGNASNLWAVVFDNAGTLVLGLINCSNATNIFPLNESSVQSPALITTGAASAGVYYANAALSSKSFRIVGYIESTQATAGAWVTGPSKIQLFGPGIKKPGDTVQTVYVTTSTNTNISSTAKVATALAASITPTSAVNKIKIISYATASTADAQSGQGPITQIYRNTGTTAIGNICPNGLADAGASVQSSLLSNMAFDSPQSSSAVQYGVYIFLNTGTVLWTFLGTNGVPANSGVMTIDEIMG